MTKYINKIKEIDGYIEKYPDSNITLNTNLRRLKKGVTYANYAIGNPIRIGTDKYSFLQTQIKSYLRICETLCAEYQNNDVFKRHIRKIMLQFVDKYLANLIEEYPLASMSGCRFGSDIMIDEKGDFKTVEVNLGCPGGPPEAIEIESILKRKKFAISSKTLANQFIYSINSFYLQFCKKNNIQPKPFNKRNYLIIENDEWTPGNFVYLDILKQRGFKVDIAPMDSVVFNAKNNTLYSKADLKKQPIDIAILYCHIQDDIIKNKPRSFIQAIKNKAVVPDASIFSTNVLASKSLTAFIAEMAQDKNNPWIKRLKINKSDLSIIRNMFPKSFHWNPELFNNSSNFKNINRFNIIESLSANELVVKHIDPGLFAGKGVYGADHKKGRKGHTDFRIELTTSVINLLNDRAKFAHYVKIFSTKQFIESYANIYENRNISKHETKAIKQIINNEILAYSKNSDINSKKFLLHISNKLMAAIKDAHKNHTNETYFDRLISYISTYMELPYILQKKIISNTPYEIRVSGFIGDKASNNLSIVSSLMPLPKNGINRPLHLYIPKYIPDLDIAKIIDSPCFIENIEKSLRPTFNNYNNYVYKLFLISTYFSKTIREQKKILDNLRKQINDNKILVFNYINPLEIREKLLIDGPILNMQFENNNFYLQTITEQSLGNKANSYYEFTEKSSFILNNSFEIFRTKYKFMLPELAYFTQLIETSGFRIISINKVETDNSSLNAIYQIVCKINKA